MNLILKAILSWILLYGVITNLAFASCEFDGLIISEQKYSLALDMVSSLINDHGVKLRLKDKDVLIIDSGKKEIEDLFRKLQSIVRKLSDEDYQKFKEGLNRIVKDNIIEREKKHPDY